MQQRIQARARLFFQGGRSDRSYSLAGVTHRLILC